MIALFKKGFIVLLSALSIGTTNPAHSQENTDVLWELVAAKEALDSELVKQLRCLAKNIYFEARGEPEKGKIAVAQVTVNRVNDPRFPDTVCEVVNQRTKDSRTNRIVCQFSWTCKPIQRVDLELYYQSYEIAKRVLLNGERISNISNAVNFHSVRINPGWTLTRVATVGNHVFYR
jgi:N-acetylmuramoyl-L-alanine amidase